MTKTLVAFFSRADENYFGGAMRYVKVGNTEIVVNGMKEMIEADTFKIEMKEPYSPVYMTCIEEAKKVFGNNLGEHIFNKWVEKHEYSNDITMSWYSDLDNECRRKIVDRANELYNK
jgi:flavodoxin